MSRATRPILPFGTDRIVLEGHGEYHVHDGEVIIPTGTVVVLHTGVGCAIDDTIAIDIVDNKKIPVKLSDNGLMATGDIDTTYGGANIGASGHMKIFRAGDDGLLNYTLLPPTTHPAFVPQPASITVAVPTTLQTLVNRYSGNSIVWAACTVIR